MYAPRPAGNRVTVNRVGEKREDPQHRTTKTKPSGRRGNSSRLGSTSFSVVGLVQAIQQLSGSIMFLGDQMTPVLFGASGLTS